MGQQIWVYSSLCAAAVAAGAVNAVAGGGTLLTFPTLLFALRSLGTGEASVVANATSTVALVPGSLAGAWGYRRELAGSRRWLILLLAPSILGGFVGALLLTVADPGYFKLVVPWLLLIASLLFLVQPYLAQRFPPHPETGRASVAVQTLVCVFQFFVSVYGGYFGAGIGILMLTSLSFMGMGDVHRINAVKTILAAVINGVSIIVFIAANKVEWNYALVMAAASVVGGYYGAVVGRRLPRWLIRAFVISVGLGLAAYYFLDQAGAFQHGSL
jgi:uncharacterized membrane protein YfcA